MCCFISSGGVRLAGFATSGGSFAGGGGPGSDTTAVHVDIASEIFGVVEKTIPVATDRLIGENASDGSKFSVEIGNITGSHLVSGTGFIWHSDATGNAIGSANLTFLGGVLSVTGSVVVDNLSLNGNTLSSTTGDIDFISASGGVFKFNSNALFAGSNATDQLEMGHGGTNAFINNTGAGGIDFRFTGSTFATFTDFGHLHLMSTVDLKHNLKLMTSNNANATGIAWENSGGNFTGTIYRQDVGSNRADMLWAVGGNSNIDLLTDALVIRGSSAQEGEVEVLTNLTVNNLLIAGNSITAIDPDGSVSLIADGTGRVALVSNLVTAGNVKNQGTVLYETVAKTVLYSASYTVHNDDHVATTGKTAGRVDVYLAEATNDTITSGAFTSGVAATSNPTVVTVGIGTFAQNDIVLFKDTLDNDGLFEVESHVGTVLTIRGIGTVARVEDFTRDQFIAATDSGVIRKVNVSVHRTSLTGTTEHGEGNVTPIAFFQLAHAADVRIKINQSFLFDDDRFFGELGLPGVQGFTDIATGSTTIDLVTELVFNETQQVVRHNDNFTNGSTTSEIALTAASWAFANTNGANFGGISRMDSTNGFDGFFTGYQADAAENPLATGNRRYGVSHDSNGGFLRLTEPDTGGTTATMDGTGGNPSIVFDSHYKYECEIPAGLGAAQFFVNGALTTFAPIFRNNTGGLGTACKLSSGSTSGANRIAYHANFGVSTYKSGDELTLTAATMAANDIEVIGSPGRRAITVVTPDGNPRGVGDTITILAQNEGSTVTLKTQVVATPESLFDGLRTLVIDVPVVRAIRALNVIEASNVYFVGAGSQVITGDLTATGEIKLEAYPNTRDDGTPINILGTDAEGNLISGPNEVIHIGGNFTDTTDQAIAIASTPQDITFNQNRLIAGMTHVAGSAIFTIDVDGTVNLDVAPQLAQGSGAATVEFWIEKNGTDIVDSNIQLTIGANSQTLPYLRWKEQFVATDTFKLRWASNSANTLLDNITSLFGGPNIPSIMLGVTHQGS